MEDQTPIRRRRVRYRGTHPRRFEEKHKEHNPDAYAADVAKVLSRGQTPAGTHRPICVKEILEILAPQSGDIGLDATLGYGGHARELLKRIVPDGCLYGLDVDPIELPLAEARLRALDIKASNLVVRRMNFAGIQQLLTHPPSGFDFVLADLGVSSMQIDNPARGFSYKGDGPLDLRFNPKRGQPASLFIRALDREELVQVLQTNADEPHAAVIARAICSHRESVQTTTQLAAIVRQALAGLPAAVRQEQTTKSLQRTFQAIRVAVNDEFEVLDRFLSVLAECLNPGGRVAILTFHSGEDRRVKKAFQKAHREGIYNLIARSPIRPSPEERRANPRSACAKLRWAVKALPA